MTQIDEFLAAKTYAVAGASNRPHKYGNKVFPLAARRTRSILPKTKSKDTKRFRQYLQEIARSHPTFTQKGRVNNQEIGESRAMSVYQSVFFTM